jgi:hypothetical protein
MTGFEDLPPLKFWVFFGQFRWIFFVLLCLGIEWVEVGYHHRYRISHCWQNFIV